MTPCCFFRLLFSMLYLKFFLSPLALSGRVKKKNRHMWANAGKISKNEHCTLYFFISFYFVLPPALAPWYRVNFTNTFGAKKNPVCVRALPGRNSSLFAGVRVSRLGDLSLDQVQATKRVWVFYVWLNKNTFRTWNGRGTSPTQLACHSTLPAKSFIPSFSYLPNCTVR